jgi:alpha-2-macroglobulin-like protein
MLLDEDEVGSKPEGRRWPFLVIFWKAAVGLGLALLIIQGFVHAWSPSPYDLTVLGQSDWRPDGPAGLHIRLLSANGGKPISAVPVEVTLAGGGKSVKLASLSTGPDGSVSPRLPIPDWPEGKYELVVSARPGSDVESVTRSIKLKRSWDVILSTDRPIYKPGQEIRLRGLALTRPDHRPLGGREMAFSVTDPKGNVVFRARPSTSRHGIAAVACPLADELIEGDYQVECKVGDTTSRSTVEVRTYVVPRFKVALQLDPADHRPGQVVRGSVSADYVFGKPVREGFLTINLEADGAGPSRVTPSDLKLDADGKARFEFRLPDRLVDRHSEEVEGRFTVTASVRDASGQVQSRSLSRSISAPSIRIDVFAESGTLVKGFPNTIYVLTSRPDGRPVSAKVTVPGQIAELRVGGSIAPRPDKVAPFTLHTDDFGLASFELTPDVDEATWVFHALADEGSEVARKVVFESREIPGDFLVRTDKAVYRRGEPIGIEVLGDGSEPVYLDLIRGDVTASSAAVPMSGGKGTLKLDLPPDLNGTLLLCAYRYSPDDGLPTRKTRVIHVVNSRDLAVKATLDRPEYRPGEKAKLAIELTDGRGKPAPGAVSLAAVDEAVFGLVKDPESKRNTFGIADDLLEPIQAIRPWSPHEFDALPAADRERVERALFASLAGRAGNSMEELKARYGPEMNYALRVLERPDWEDLARGMDLSPALIEALRKGSGPHTLATHTYPEKLRKIQETRSQINEWMRIAWGVLFLVVLIVGLVLIARIFRAAGAVIIVTLIILVLIGLLMPAVQSARRSARRTSALNDLKQLELEFQSGKAEPGGETRVRRSFPETLLWRPELVTDDNGRASLDLDLADSITTWRLSADAVTLDGRLGGTRSSIRVFQPFFVELEPPVALIRDDEMAIPVIVSNHLDRSQRVTLRLDEATGFDRLDASEQVLELGAGEVRVVHFGIIAASFGRHEIQVSAEGEGVADAVRRPVDIVLEGRPVERVVGGQLTEPAEVDLTVPGDAIAGSVKAFVKIYPSSFSQLVEGLDAIFQMPHGCFEQTSSTTYPNILALDYLRKTGQAAPKVEARAKEYIHLGYQRLLSFEVAGGGFDWFGRAPANRTLTAYGLMEFEDMARVHEVDRALIDRTRKWLLDQQKADGSWDPEGHGLESGSLDEASDARLGTSAYVARAVFAGQASDVHSRASLAYLRGRSQSIGDPYTLALVAGALLAIEPAGNSARPYLDRLESLRKSSDDGKLAWWESAVDKRTLFYGSGQARSIETTSLATQALLGSGRSPASVRGSLSWLIASKDGRGTWHSTQATVLALKALLAGTGRPLGGDKPRRISLSLDGRSLEDVVIPSDQADVLRQVEPSKWLAKGSHRLTLEDKGGADSGYQVVLRYHVPESHAPEPQGPLAIRLDYNRSKVAVDEPVTATVTVSNAGPDSLAMVVLELPIPAGFAVVGNELETLAANGTIAKSQRNPRQVVIYLRDLAASKPLTLSYRLSAPMAANVASPPAVAYEYYGPDRRATSRGSRLVVESR